MTRLLVKNNFTRLIVSNFLRFLFEKIASVRVKKYFPNDINLKYV